MGKAGSKLNAVPGFVLACSTPAKPTLSGAGTDASGVPYSIFTKDVISCGEWQVPETGQKFSVDEARIDRWVSTFNAMSKAGVEVPIPLGHTFEPDKNRGFVQGFFRDGDTLKMTAKMIGEDAKLAAARNLVSLFAVPEFEDAKGNKYQDAILHVALTPVPVIPGQQGFIAASRGGLNVNAPVFRLAMEPSTMNQHLLSLAQKFGVDTSACTCDQELHDAIAAKKPADEKAPEAVAMAKKLDETEKALALARTELAAATKAEDNPRVLKLTRESRALRLDALVSAGHATPAFVKAAKARHCPADDKALALSLTPAADAMFEGMLEDLKLIDFKTLQEQSKTSVALSRTVPGDGPDPSKPDPEVIKRAAESRGYKVPARS